MRPFLTKEEEIISVGVDIGSSTTKMVISRLQLMNMRGSSYVPKVEIVNRQVLYQSPIYRTPLLTDDWIDTEQIFSILMKEYGYAGVPWGSIHGGAVIITGETATKRNAKEVLHYLAEKAGDFVVATAGPDFEGILAGKGSGAWARSKRCNAVIANLDIGGGTTNIAIFKKGQVIGTCTLQIGGRAIEMERGTIKRVSPVMQQWTEACVLKAGDRYSDDKLINLANRMTKTIADVLAGYVLEEDYPLLVGQPPDWIEPIEEIMFSGGVAACMTGGGSDAELYHEYCDIGAILAKALKNSVYLHRWKQIEAAETSRATVLGAGMQTIEVSGSTIHFHDHSLPLRNLPVVKVSLQDCRSSEEIHERLIRAVERGIRLFDPQMLCQPFAIAITDLTYTSFEAVQKLAVSLLEALRPLEACPEPLVIVTNQDMAKALGQTLQRLSQKQVIAIDQIEVENGDYIDLGKPLEGSGVVPVIVKTLAFHQS